MGGRADFCGKNINVQMMAELIEPSPLSICPRKMVYEFSSQIEGHIGIFWIDLKGYQVTCERDFNTSSR